MSSFCSPSEVTVDIPTVGICSVLKTFLLMLKWVFSLPFWCFIPFKTMWQVCRLCIFSSSSLKQLGQMKANFTVSFHRKSYKFPSFIDRIKNMDAMKDSCFWFADTLKIFLLWNCMAKSILIWYGASIEAPFIKFFHFISNWTKTWPLCMILVSDWLMY